MTYTHPIHPADHAPLVQLRAQIPDTKRVLASPDARQLFDQFMLQTPAAVGVRYEQARIGGVPGWWCHPAGARSDAVLLHLHGGAFAIGSAYAYRHFAGQIAESVGTPSFVPDYRLAPEHPFPAACEDVAAVYEALAELHPALVLVGDSAGGGLALSQLAARPRKAPRGVVTLSPWTDLALTSASLETRAAVDYLSRDGLAATAARYLAGHDPRDPGVSPVYGHLAGLAPVLIHVGDDEVLLDDSLRYAARHAQCSVHVWAGMPHVFPARVGSLQASSLALQHVGEFVRSLL